MTLASHPSAVAATVLVVDDNEANRALASASLEDEGYRVVAVESGAAGIAAFEREAPDCLLLDVRMPHMDGVSVCERTRALRRARRGAREHFELLKQHCRLQLQKERLTASSVDLGRLVEDIISELEVTARVREVRLEARVAVTRAWLDEDLMRRAVANLVDNAVKYVPAGRAVVVATRRDGDAPGARFSVRLPAHS